MRISRALGVALALICFGGAARAEDGHEAWLRYHALPAGQIARYAPMTVTLVAGRASPTLDAAARELRLGLSGLLRKAPASARAVSADGAVVIGTAASSPVIAGLRLDLSAAGKEGFVLRTMTVNGHKATVIAANSDIGVLYGAFAFLRRLQTAQPIDALNVADAPRLMVRVLNHWDNLDGSIERGFAGASLWRWQTLPAYRDPRYREYARLNASIGINGAVLNNVNTSAQSLTEGYIEKTAALAEEFRPYGVKVWMAPRFSAPQEIGGLKTSDPLDPQVRAWWKAKVEEIYKAIPDFGGFLVKANSEGQPGPQDYGRSHSDGANMYADLLAPHGGIVMYRAFVYDDPGKDWHLDRVAEAYRIIKPFDGQFRDNVLVQEKEGPLDFQPREPFAPLFGAMPKTNMAVEFPVTKEYTGQGVDLTYTGFMYEQIYRSDTFAHGPGSTVVKIVMNQKLTGSAGVANIGNDRNWTGSIFNQANWYAYGRFAWNPESSARAVGEEWVRQTFGNDPKTVTTAVDILMASWPAMMDYQSPIGLTFQELDRFNTHYGPWPWLDSPRRSDWADVYFNRADDVGLGVDRSHTGYNTAAQYNSPLKEQFDNIATTPEEFLLWFHHVPWDFSMKSGRSMWEELQYTYSHGVAGVETMQKQWATLRGKVDDERFTAVTQYLVMQHRDAVWFRDASLAYFQTFAKRPFTGGYKPKYPLDYYKNLPPNTAPPD
jgi:alpha-glucuronidase